MKNISKPIIHIIVCLFLLIIFSFIFFNRNIESSSELDWRAFTVDFQNYPEDILGNEIFRDGDMRITLYFTDNKDEFFSDSSDPNDEKGSELIKRIIEDKLVYQRFFRQITSTLIEEESNNDLFLIINMYHAEGDHSNNWILEELIESITW